MARGTQGNLNAQANSWTSYVNTKNIMLASFVFLLIVILGGAIGNIFDRIFYGYVVDFIQVNIYIMWWPAFNIADSVIVIGMALLCIEVLRGKQIFETKHT